MIIIINSPPSAGKTTIIKELQKLYDKPLLHQGIDNFWKMIPDQYKECGEKAAEGYAFIQTTDNDNNPVIEVKRGPFAEHMDHTMAKVIQCLADCGHDVAVDVVLRKKIILDHYIKTLNNHTVYFIGITCDTDELERREKSRANRMIGLAKGCTDFIDQYKDYYDLIIDSTYDSAATCAQNILDFIQKTPTPTRFKRLD